MVIHNHIIRLWRVPATLPHPDFIFTTRTLPEIFFYISGFRVVTTHAVFTELFSPGLYQWCQPIRRKRIFLKIVKIDRNAEHLQFIMEMALILLKRRGGKLSFYVFYIKVTWSSAGSVRFSWVIFSWLRLSAQIGPEPTSDKNSQTGHRMIF